MKHVQINALDEVVASTEKSGSAATKLLDGKTQSLWETANVDEDALLVGRVEGMADNLGVVNTSAKGATVTGIHHLSGSSQDSISDDVIDAILETDSGILGVFCGDTRNDTNPDWPDSATTQGWYSGTAFPRKYAITIKGTGGISLWDISTSTPIEFMAFNHNALVRSPATCSIVNGVLTVGSGDVGIQRIFFLSDTAKGHRYSSTNTFQGNWTTGLANRNTAGGWDETVLSGGLPNAVIAQVDSVVLTTSSPDTATGLEIPTSVGATGAGGVWILDDESIVGATGAISLIACSINSAGRTVWASSDKLYIFNSIPSSDTALTNADYIFDTAGTTSPHISGTIYDVEINEDDTIFTYTSDGLFEVEYNAASGVNSGVLKIDKDVNSGMQKVGCVLAALMDTVTGDTTGVGVVTDHTINSNDLDVTGTISRVAADTDTEAVFYTGFETIDYISQPTNTDLDFGTADFYISFTLDLRVTFTAAHPDSTIVDRGSGGGMNRMHVYYSHLYGRIGVELNDGTNDTSIEYTGGTDWTGTPHIVIARVAHASVPSLDELRIYVDNVLVATTTTTLPTNISISSPLMIGLTFNSTYPSGIPISRVMVFNETVNSEIVADLYSRESLLFKKGARQTLQGTSNQVNSGSYNPQSGSVACATPDGTTFFYNGCVSRYIDATDTPTSDNHLSVSSTYGAYCIGTAAEAVVYDLNSSLEISSVAAAVSDTTTFFLPLSEQAEQYDKISVYLDCREDGNRMSSGILFAGEDLYTGSSIQYGSVKYHVDLSEIYTMNNGSKFIVDKGRLSAFDVTISNTGEAAKLFMLVHKANGATPGLWQLTDYRGDETAIYGHVEGEPQQGFDSYNRDVISATIKEDK